MKKLAVLLAIAMALSCCLLMLAACGDSEDTSSAAETSSDAASSNEETSGEESSAASDASFEETSDAVSDETTEESPAGSEPDDGNDPENGNLALGKSYTKSQLFQQGETVNDDGTKAWGWLDTAPVSYPDSGDKELTDGKLAANDSGYGDEEWMGFHSGCPDYTTNGYSYFTVDLGDSCDLTKLVVYVGTSKLGGGIGVPATVDFLVSEDGEKFTSVGSVTPADDPNNSVLAVEQACSVTARYVQVRMTAANWMFVCEFEAY